MDMDLEETVKSIMENIKNKVVNKNEPSSLNQVFMRSIIARSNSLKKALSQSKHNEYYELLGQTKIRCPSADLFDKIISFLISVDTSGDDWINQFENTKENPYEEIKIIDWQVKLSSVVITVEFNFSNKQRGNSYFSFPCRVVMSINKKNFFVLDSFSFEFINTDQSICPDITKAGWFNLLLQNYKLSTQRGMHIGSCHTAVNPSHYDPVDMFTQKKSYTIFSFIHAIIFPFLSVSNNTFLQSCGADFNVDRFLGPVCGYSGDWTYGNYVKCAATHQMLSVEHAVNINGNHYSPIVVKACSNCGTSGVSWVHQDDKIVCGGCNNNEHR